MSGHTMTVEWNRGRVDYRIKCANEAQAPCRFEFDCECEGYVGNGIDPERGPWHGITEGYMTDDEERSFRKTGERPRHYGQFGGECQYALWINDGDCIDELGFGPVTFPVDVEWDGDDWTWSTQ